MILSHRGYWFNQEEKNSIEAFKRSFSMGFGTETDVRDFNGELVISHDIPKSNVLTLDEFFKIFISYDKSLPLALNIKSDGLQRILSRLINKYKIENYFVFDMSVPDTLGYLKENITFYSRQSEYEVNPPLYENSNGIWMDEFKEHWITKEAIKKHLDNSKNVCIVSPELHKRSYLKEWKQYANQFDIVNSIKVSICTDKPEEAKKFFK